MSERDYAAEAGRWRAQAALHMSVNNKVPAEACEIAARACEEMARCQTPTGQHGRPQLSPASRELLSRILGLSAERPAPEPTVFNNPLTQGTANNVPPFTTTPEDAMGDSAGDGARLRDGPLSRNVIIADSYGFVGEWIAVPREDFNEARRLLRAAAPRLEPCATCQAFHKDGHAHPGNASLDEALNSGDGSYRP